MKEKLTAHKFRLPYDADEKFKQKIAADEIGIRELIQKLIKAEYEKRIKQ